MTYVTKHTNACYVYPFPNFISKSGFTFFSYFLESTNSTILLDAMLQALIICIKSLLSGLRCVSSNNA